MSAGYIKSEAVRDLHNRFFFFMQALKGHITSKSKMHIFRDICHGVVCLLSKIMGLNGSLFNV